MKLWQKLGGVLFYSHIIRRFCKQTSTATEVDLMMSTQRTTRRSSSSSSRRSRSSWAAAAAAADDDDDDDAAESSLRARTTVLTSSLKDCSMVVSRVVWQNVGFTSPWGVSEWGCRLTADCIVWEPAFRDARGDGCCKAESIVPLRMSA